MQTHTPLETYLTTVERTLATLPATEREAEVEEIRQHLRSAVAAGLELGLTEAEAIALALKQFGKPQEVGKEMRTAFRRGHYFWNNSSWRNTFLGAVCAAIVISKATFVLEVFFWTIGLPDITIFGTGVNTEWAVTTTGCLLHLIAGVGVGLLTPRHAVRGVVHAYLLLTAWAWLRIAVMDHFHPSEFLIYHGKDHTMLGLTILFDLIFTVVYTIIALGVCLTGVVLTRKLAKSGPRRALQA